VAIDPKEAEKGAKDVKGVKVKIEKCLNKFFEDSYIEDVACNTCDIKTKMMVRQRFITFPKVLCIVLQRFVFENWVPKKLCIELEVPHGDEEAIDF